MLYFQIAYVIQQRQWHGEISVDMYRHILHTLLLPLFSNLKHRMNWIFAVFVNYVRHSRNIPLFPTYKMFNLGREVDGYFFFQIFHRVSWIRSVDRSQLSQEFHEYWPVDSSQFFQELNEYWPVDSSPFCQCLHWECGLIVLSCLLLFHYR